MLRVLTLSDNLVQDEVINSFVQMVSETPSLHAYTTVEMFKAIKSDVQQQSLCQVAAWCIGEFGDLLITGAAEADKPLQVGIGKGFYALNDLMILFTTSSFAFTIVNVCMHMLFSNGQLNNNG